jgi:hypothetical protein
MYKPNQITGQQLTTLNTQRLPGRLDANQAAALLGFQPYEIPLLVRAKLLRALGKPSQNSRKFFAASEIQAKMEDGQWLDAATKAVAKLIQEANGKRAGTGPTDHIPRQSDSEG